MQAVIYLDLRDQPLWGYQKPVLDWVNNNYRHVTTLDIDNRSDKMLVDYACRLLKEAEQAVLFIEAEPEAQLRAAAPIIEQVLRQENQCLILLHGHHNRLEKMLEARPRLRWHQHEEEHELREEITSFLQESGTEN